MRRLLAGIPPEKIRSVVATFKAVEHRLEYVATVGGVEYYNDSKATNVDATIKALESFPGDSPYPRRQGQGQRLRVLNALLKERVKRVYAIGAAAAKIEARASGAESFPSEPGSGREARKRSGDRGRHRPAGSGMCQLRSV